MATMAKDAEVAISLTTQYSSAFDDTAGPQLGMRITLKDVTFSVPSNKNRKEKAYLLTNVSGFFLPYEMAALMGPSGSGKTTLLDLLAGRKTTGKTDGTVLFAGQKPTRQFLRRYTGYVEQFDTLLDMLTVEEMLLYTAELKRPMSETFESKKAAVKDLLNKLGLDVCRHVIIGNPLTKGISGGQAKRTNIGIALITNPRVLFLDEPTSGLDSYTSNEVMTVVKALAKEGTTMCATIHSPTSYCFNLFDKLMMLVRGRVVYFGNTDASAAHFSRTCGQVLPMSEGYNEAEWLVDLITEADRKKRGAEIADAWDASDSKKESMALLEGFLQDKEEVPEHIQKELAVHRDTVTPMWWAIKTWAKYRTAKNYRRMEFLGPRLGDKLIVTFIIFTLYFGIGDDLKQSNLINIAAVLFMSVAMPAFGAASYVPTIVLERGLFYRERADGIYTTLTYLMAKMMDELTLAVALTVVVSACSFYAIDLQGDFVLYWITYMLTLFIGIVLAYTISALSPNMDVANAALPAYAVTLMFFAGFLIHLNDIPSYWKWYSYISFLKYSWGAVMVNQFEGKRDVLYLGQSTVLETYSLDDVNKWEYVGYLCAFFAFFFVAAWAALRFSRHEKR